MNQLARQLVSYVLQEIVHTAWELKEELIAFLQSEEALTDERQPQYASSCKNNDAKVITEKPELILEVSESRPQKVLSSPTVQVSQSGAEIPKQTSKKITLKEANIQVRELLPVLPEKERTVRALAKEIGCAVGTISNTPVWKTYQEGLKKTKTPSSPVVVSLTDEVLATHGEDEDELQRLTEEQRVDQEESESRQFVRRRKL